jgi:hypothetical protein
VDRAGRLAAQHDGPPDGGQQPTSGWTAGTTVADLHQIAWAGDVAAVDLEVGWYDPKSGDRLPLPGSATGSLTLGPVTALLPPATAAAPDQR